MFHAFAHMKIESTKILAIIRAGDYAHPGEEEAIELTLKPISKQADRKVLDVGCGLGGTAKYVQDHSWGHVTGVDINPEKRDYAIHKYPDVTFVTSDVIKMPNILKKKYQLLYLFNSFYSFPDQQGALQAMRQVADDHAELVIFEYVNKGSYDDPLLKVGEDAVLPYTIEMNDFKKDLADASWQLKEIKNIDAEYQRWYEVFMEMLEQRKSELIKKAGQDAYDAAHYIYGSFLEEIKRGGLGGSIFYAQAI